MMPFQPDAFQPDAFDDTENMTSPNNSRIPIIDETGARWTHLENDWVYRNGARTSGHASQSVLVIGKGFYAQSPTGPKHWWRAIVAANGSVSWVDVGVNDPSTGNTPPPGPTITITAPSMAPGAPVTVHLTGGAGNPTDWLYMYGGSPAKGWGQIYAPTATFDWATTLPTEVGTYQINYYLNNSTVVAAQSAPFTVAVPYAAPVFSFPNPLPLTVSVQTSLAPYVSSPLPLVWTAQDTPQLNLTADGKLTAKVAGTATATVEVDDGH